MQQAVGSYYRGKHLGTFGDVGILSFNRTNFDNWFRIQLSLIIKSFLKNLNICQLMQN